MVEQSLPRYFVPRQGAQASSRSLFDFIPSLLLDQFIAGMRHTREHGYIVGLDATGELAAINRQDVQQLPEYLQSQISNHEITSNGDTRLLQARSFYLFDLQLMEQAGDVRGYNDPVYLYGTITGPFPTSDGRYQAVEGQLTVNRSDIIAGIIQGYRWCFQGDAASNRGFHIMLPGAPEEEVAAGDGIVLAYPLLSAENMISGTSNEALLLQILYDVLSALKQDLGAEKLNHFLLRTTLPVPSRSLLEEDLKAQGYQIKGDYASRNTLSVQLQNPTNRPKGFKGLLSAAFGSFMPDKLELPPEGTLDDLIVIARKVITSLPQWPPSRTQAIMNRIDIATTEMKIAARSSSSTNMASLSKKIVLPADVNQIKQSQLSSKSNKSTDWMHDFVFNRSNHNKTTNGPRLTSSQETSKTIGNRISAVSKAQWMKDFEQSPPNASNSSDLTSLKPGETGRISQGDGNTETRSSQKKKTDDEPDWMKDFQ